MKQNILILILILFTQTIIAQEFSKFTEEDYKKDANYGHFNYLQVMYHQGQHPSGTNFMSDIFQNGYNAFTLRVGTQATGRKEWQRIHNYPQYGLGFSAYDLGGAEADSVIGAPGALFFYFGAPWARLGKFTFNTDIEIGLSYDFKPYNPDSNPRQDVIGSSVNVHFSLNFVLYYQLSNRMDINLGYALTHFSNGRSFTPQMGINLLGFNIGASYHFNPVKNYTKLVDPDFQPNIRPEFVQAEKPAIDRFHELQFMGAIGTVLTQRPYGEPIGIRYMTSSISINHAYKFIRRMKSDVGFDIFYDGSLVETYPDWETRGATTFEKMTFGTHLGFQYLIERFSFVYNLGLYVRKETTARGSFYMRAGGRIGLTDNLDVHIMLKTQDGGIADWIEWGLAYKLKLKKNN